MTQTLIYDIASIQARGPCEDSGLEIVSTEISILNYISQLLECFST